MTVIETRRLLIREMVPEDLEELYRVYDDEEVIKYLDPLDTDRAAELEKLQAYIEFAYAFYGFGFWAVCEKETGRLIGRCGFSVEEIENEVYVELGYMIAADRRRLGYAGEAVHAVLEYAGEELELETVAACISHDNKASIALAQREGFIYQEDFVRRGRKLGLYLYRCE